ncbi:MAG: GGDEF domain-containing protein [Comamonadaceae bacterium CG_4_9_14_3_um_filter_60_33]|nr:MAG: GGDEF domain-containing protein [Comamonadaceae bacterium CG_4_10_14_3_um_filter_60_42]PJB44413.1 MAG: GGDEF domain-containing protein [Comamonadaceae bacterium CG_4_9_14_3_um_filter_60_33]
MSLIKQLWIAIILVLSIAFGGSMVVSVLSARHYLEQQLQVKNIDNANALALSLTQLKKDEVMVGLLVAAQFDVGHYRFIRIVSPTGQTLVERVAANLKPAAPDWFVKLIPIRTTPGQALIQDGWSQYGTLTLASHDSYAYQSLWDGTLELLLWFVFGAAITGMVGTLLMRSITRPLGEVVGQAQAIAERRFLTITEPRTPELKSVAHAMNVMVDRLKAMFNDEAARLETLRKKVNHDAVTGLSSRDYFLSHLREAVQGDQFDSLGTLVLVRLPDLDDLNAHLGRQQTDALLKDVAHELAQSGANRIGQRAGRIKGAEFAIVCPSLASATEAAHDIHERLTQNLLPKWRDRVPDLFHISAVRYHHDQNLSELLARADETLAQAASLGPNSWHAVEDSTAKAALPAEQWRALLTEAVAGGRLALSFYPVMSGDGTNPMHQEGMLRLKLDAAGSLLSAGDFMPMAAQLNLTAPIDLGVVKLAIEHLRSTAGDIAVNLSAATVANFGFRHELIQLLKTYPEVCQRLLIEVPEYGVFKQFEAFRDLAHQLKQLGCRVGVEYFGQSFAESGKLADLGLDYIKVHPSYIRDIANNEGNQEFLKGLCKVAHAIGITVVAQGVENQADLPLLAALGFDGVTGPGVK